MNTETHILTVEQIVGILHNTPMAPKDGHHVVFARAIEQAVLQSPEVQALRHDLGVMTSAVRILSGVVEMFAGELGADLDESKVSVTANGNEVTSVSVRTVIDKARAAMEKQP